MDDQTMDLAGAVAELEQFALGLIESLEAHEPVSREEAARLRARLAQLAAVN